jgi:hypothetical protein
MKKEMMIGLLLLFQICFLVQFFFCLRLVIEMVCVLAEVSTVGSLGWVRMVVRLSVFVSCRWTFFCCFQWW